MQMHSSLLQTMPCSGPHLQDWEDLDFNQQSPTSVHTDTYLGNILPTALTGFDFLLCVKKQAEQTGYKTHSCGLMADFFTVLNHTDCVGQVFF